MAFTERSAASRSAIVDAARRLLASKGYEATTIRAVAAEAGIDASMVMRYYGSKEGLFAAAVDIDLQLPDASEWPRGDVGAHLAAHAVARWESAQSNELMVMLLRSAATNEAAAGKLREVSAGQVRRFVGSAIGDAPDADRRAGLLSVQMLGMALCRYVLELPPVAAMDTDDLVAYLAPMLQHVLYGDLGASVTAGQRLSLH